MMVYLLHLLRDRNRNWLYQRFKRELMVAYDMGDHYQLTELKALSYTDMDVDPAIEQWLTYQLLVTAKNKQLEVTLTWDFIRNQLKYVPNARPKHVAKVFKLFCKRANLFCEVTKKHVVIRWS